MNTEQTLQSRLLDTPSKMMDRWQGGCLDVHEYGEWHVHAYLRDDEIVVYASDYCDTSFSYARTSGHHDNIRAVRKPTPRRIDRAIRSCQKWCDRKNAALARARRMAELLEGSNG